MTVADFFLSLLASGITGVALWMTLPRGAVLTRTPGLPNQWTIKNDSPVAIALTSVTYEGIDTMEDGELLEKEAPLDPPEDAPLRLVPDEEREVYRLTLEHGRWKGFVIRPGDTFTATVFANRSLTIRYRRAGWTGMLERRSLVIDGGA